jgi:hypothetical protein
MAFNQRADRREMVIADDQIALPMARFRPVEGRERPVVDGEHRLLKPWPSALWALMRSAVISSGTQR